MTATFVMALQDAIVKLVSSDLPLWQIFTVRSLIAITLLTALLVFGGERGRVRPAALRWALLRGSLLVAMYVAFYAALPFVQLSVVAAAYYTGPLFITIFAAVLIGERTTARVKAGLLLGFLGVLVTLRPDSESFSAAMLIPIASAICYALAMVLTRGRCSGDTAISLSFALNFCFVLCGLAMTAFLAVADLPADLVAAEPFLLGPWVPMHGSEWGIIGTLAALNVCIHLALARAYQIGAPATVAIFDYSYLGFAVLWGFVLLSEVPSPGTLAGIVLIAAAGILVVTARAARAGKP